VCDGPQHPAVASRLGILTRLKRVLPLLLVDPDVLLKFGANGLQQGSELIDPGAAVDAELGLNATKLSADLGTRWMSS